MKIEITERKLLDMSDGRTMSLHPGVIECEDALAEELLAAGHARPPAPPSTQPILKSSGDVEPSQESAAPDADIPEETGPEEIGPEDIG